MMMVIGSRLPALLYHQTITRPFPPLLPPRLASSSSLNPFAPFHFQTAEPPTKHQSPTTHTVARRHPTTSLQSAMVLWARSAALAFLSTAVAAMVSVVLHC